LRRSSVTEPVERASFLQPAVELRRALHNVPELADGETRTAALIADFLRGAGASAVVENLGGHGVAAVYEGGEEGPRVLARCELDALPIPDVPEATGSRENAVASHKCGHDGHMAILAGLALLLRSDPPAAGEVVLLFQPSEETGAGARRVLDDPAFARLRPDVVFALHNVPGYPLGSVLLRDGVFASTARSLRVALHGRTAHAGEPHKGVSPASALAGIIAEWPALPYATTSLDEAAMVTVVHAVLGEPALGTSPGEAVAIATLRAQNPEVMEKLSEACLRLATGMAAAHSLEIEHEWLEEFPCTASDPKANSVVERAAEDAGAAVVRLERPFSWTEDFGHFTGAFGGAMFGLGSGEGTAPLHHRDYAFPDELVTLGADLFRRVVRTAGSEIWSR